MRGTKKKNSFTRALFRQRLLGLLSLIVVGSLIGFVGLRLYPPFLSSANTGAATNPQLTRACGIDVALLVDTSGSMRGIPKDNAYAGIRSFVNTLKNTDTQFAVGTIDEPLYGSPPFTQDTNEIIRRLNYISGGTSNLRDPMGSIALDPRPDRPNLLIVLSDFFIEYNQASVNAVKQSGTRILALAYGGVKPQAAQNAIDIAGPKVDTDSIFTSDVVYVDPSTIEARFQEFARQLCFSGATPGVTPGLGDGNGGTGTGTNGQGQGSGQSSGAGGGGGGGSSAISEADKPTPLPSTASQGNTTEQPKVEPSPFFDGKLFTTGSDSDRSIEKNKTVGIGGLRIGYGWFGLLALAVGVLAGYFFWWRKLAPKEQLRLKRKLLFKK